MLHIWTYARHSWPMSSEGSLASNTYCDTGHPFIMVISEDPWHSHLLPTFGSAAVAAGIRTPNVENTNIFGFKFSLYYKYLGKRVCVLTRQPAIFGEEVNIYFYNSKFWESMTPALSRFGYPHSLSRSVMFLACHVLGACKNMHARPHCEVVTW